MRLDGRLGIIISGLAGLALPLGFAPFNVFAVVPLSLAVLFHVWSRVPARRALLCGWLYGLASFGFGVFWIHESFQFNHIAIGWALLLTALLVMFLALYPAAVGCAVRWIAVRNALSERSQLVLLMPSMWVLAEWVRGWFFTGFTWLQLGYSQVGAPLQSLLPVGGIYAAGLAVAVSAALLVLALGARGIARWLPEMRAPTLARYLELTRQHWDADLIVWPESALPGLRDNFDAFIDDLAGEARRNNSFVVFGVPVLNRKSLEYYNSVFIVGGREMVYHKRHLVPFGEYLPLDALIRPVTEALGLPVADFSLGPDTQPLLEAAGHRLGVSICYEIAFGNEIVQTLPDAAVLVTVSNDAWFGTSIGPHQHLQIARARALETGRYLLRATNTGITAIVAPDGAIEGRAPQFQVQVLAGRIYPMGGLTPYARTGDTAIIALAVLMLIGAIVIGRRRPARDDRD
jgi:apolipoprotein N-acyltransferase